MEIHVTKQEDFQFVKETLLGTNLWIAASYSRSDDEILFALIES